MTAREHTILLALRRAKQHALMVDLQRAELQRLHLELDEAHRHVHAARMRAWRARQSALLWEHRWRRDAE